jgi:hypothetical protein
MLHTESAPRFGQIVADRPRAVSRAEFEKVRATLALEFLSTSRDKNL